MIVIGTYLSVREISIADCIEIMDFAPHVPICYRTSSGEIRVFPGNYDCDLIDESTPGMLSEFRHEDITEDLVAECKVSLMSSWLPFINELRSIGATVDAKFGVIEHACR